MNLVKNFFRLTIVLFAAMFTHQAQAGWTSEYVTMEVGETRTLYLPSSVTSLYLTSVGFYSNANEYVEVVSQMVYSVTVKAKKPTPTAIVVRCDYYYHPENNPLLTYPGAYDFMVTVNGSGGSGGGGGSDNGPTSLYVDPSSITLKVGETEIIQAIQAGAFGGTSFYSTNPSVARVSKGQHMGPTSYTTMAVVTALSPGKTNVWAENVNGLSAVCVVTVLPNPDDEPDVPDEFTVEGIKYKTNSDRQTVSVASNQDTSLSGTLDIPSTVTYDSHSLTVTSIDENAFYECRFLSSVTIPNSVTTIGQYAFYDCYSLTSLIIPNSVITIGDYAFDFCFGLKSLTIGNSVTTIGERAFSRCTGLTSIVIPNSVATIGFGAFFNCTGLISIYIPGSVTSIGSSALNGCSALTSINIPNSVTQIPSSLLEGCTSLTTCVIPNSVTLIGRSALEKCSSLITLIIPSSVTMIEDFAFRDCTGLTTIIVENSNQKYDSRDNCNAIIETSTNTLIVGCKNTIIPTSVTSIGNYAFCNCSSLTSMTIPNSVITIGSSSFFNCRGLTSMILPNSVVKIDSYAFCGCSGLNSVTIGDSVTSIGASAFQFCRGLTSIIIPNSVTTIGAGAFNSCTSLTSVIIPKSVDIIGNAPFNSCTSLVSIIVENENQKYDSRDNCNAIIETATNTLIAGCKSTIIPNTVTTIGYSAFAGCSGLMSVSIPNSVTSIGHTAFYRCTGLKSVSIPNSITSIDDFAFDECYNLTKLSIPNSVTSIGKEAFAFCGSLASIWSRIENPESVTMGEDVFKGVYRNNCILYVPTGTLAKYRAADQWKAFVNILVEESAITTVDVDRAKVMVTDGHISVVGARDVKVYSLSGMLVGTGAETDVTSGTYIVVADGKSTKVLVK